MSSARETVRVPGRAARQRWTALLFIVASASCEALFGNFGADNPDNCVRNTALCPAPDQTCNPATTLCEPAVIFTAVDPPGGPNTGGTTLTITGQNFTDGMTVNIDGAPATGVMVSGPGQLTAVTPARRLRQGPVPIELINSTGQHVLQNKLFRYYSNVSFQVKCFQGPSGVKTIAAVDLNGDGKVDLVTAGSDVIRTYLNAGDGQTFGSPFDVPTLENLQRIGTADLNGDGKPDVTTMTGFPFTAVTTALGNGDGTLQMLVMSPTPHPPSALTFVDIDGDKRLDALSLQDKNLVTQLGNGDGTFKSAQTFAYSGVNSGSGSSLSLVDLDGDGILDAVPTNQAASSLAILFGPASGWSIGMPMVLPAAPRSTFVGDYNQDGVLDILVGLDPSLGGVAVVQGSGGRKFSVLPTVPLPQGANLAIQGDFNGDGLADFATTDLIAFTNNMGVYLGTGNAHFVAMPLLTLPTGLTAAAVADLDGDGKQDLVTSSMMGDNICLLRSTVQ